MRTGGSPVTKMAMTSEENTSLLKNPKEIENNSTRKSCRYQVVTLLSVIDEESNEDIYEDLDDCESLSRYVIIYSGP